jgi:hypothetical protein
LLGHTHDLVDQFFSRISTKINTSDTCINTLQQLKKLITKSYDVTTGDVHVEFIEEVPDLAEWTSKLNMPHVVGVSVPHCFIIYSRKNTQKNELGITTTIMETVVETKFLSTSESDVLNNPPIVMLSGPLIILPDPISIPKAPLNYSALRKMVDTYSSIGEFTEDEEKEWNEFINEHEENVKKQCKECNRIQQQIADIGPISRAPAGDINRKKIETEKTREKEGLKKQLHLHLQSSAHSLSDGWLCFPKAGEDVEYNYDGVTEQEVVEINEKFNSTLSTKSTLSEKVKNLNVFKLNEDGTLLEPTGELISYRHGGGTKISTVVQELTDNVRKLLSLLMLFWLLLLILLLFLFD